MSAVSQSELVGQVLDEKYLIEKELGRGGMGSVYLANHVGTDRPVALKVIAPQFMREAEFVERFRREAKAAGRLYHPNVVNVTDFGFARVGTERVAYLVMEYLEGCPLSDILAEETELPLEWVIDILEQTCSAVDQAHRLGIIHRDLKPDNIWLLPNRRGGYTVKVLDFGLAKLAESTGGDHGEAASGELSSSAPPTSVGMASVTTHAAPRSPTETGSNTGDGDALEAVTQIQSQPAADAAKPPLAFAETTARPAPEDDPEAVTQMLQANVNDVVTKFDKRLTTVDDRPERARGGETMDQLPAAQTAVADGLTRLGSILGTPLYMSPEQCRSESLDARSDIYSLGVIAYQMLAGKPPFTGSIYEVMKQHIESPAPPLRQVRPEVPKRLAALVMSALAKHPNERPARAEGFASAIRASAEGTAKLFRRALSLYTEHFPKFFRVSIILNLPMIALTLIQFANQLLGLREGISPRSVKITNAVVSVVMVGVNFVSTSVILGVTIRMVTQVFLAPLRPLELRPAYAALRKRLMPLLFTSMISGLRVLLGMVLCVIPGLWLFINYSLAGPIVMMEGLKGRAALKRSKTLVRRSRRTVIAVAIIEWALPSLAAGLVGAWFGVLLKGTRVPHAAELTGGITGMTTTLLNVFFIPLLATMTALLYLKTRQIGGETLEEVLGLFEADEAPRTKWQQKMKERLYSSTPSA